MNGNVKWKETQIEKSQQKYNIREMKFWATLHLEKIFREDKLFWKISGKSRERLIWSPFSTNFTKENMLQVLSGKLC